MRRHALCAHADGPQGNDPDTSASQCREGYRTSAALPATLSRVPARHNARDVRAHRVREWPGGAISELVDEKVRMG